MNDLLFFRRGRRTFEKASFQESDADLPNPGRGWYRLFTFAPQEGFPRQEWEYSLDDSQKLVLLMIDLSAYARGDIDQEGLSRIEESFGFFSRRHKQLLLRFVYDREGKCMAHEPTSLSVIERHMDSLSPLLDAYAPYIFCIQGLFVGNWGEMHGSRYVSETGLVRLAQKLFAAAPGSCFLAVRKPVQWRMINRRQDFEETAPMGLFNDGIFGSATDLGTYGVEDHGGWKTAWTAASEVAFQQELCLRVPNGGEVVAESAEDGRLCFIPPRETVERLRRMHVSYLNCQHDKKLLDHWKHTPYKGTDLYTYIGRRLGYRFLVSDAKLSGSSLVVTVKNTGFAPFYQQGAVRIIVKKRQTDGEEDAVGTVLTGADMRLWKPGEQHTVAAELGGMLGREQDGPLFVYLSLVCTEKEIPVYLANAGAGKTLYLGGIHMA